MGQAPKSFTYTYPRVFGATLQYQLELPSFSLNEEENFLASAITQISDSRVRISFAYLRFTQFNLTFHQKPKEEWSVEYFRGISI